MNNEKKNSEEMIDYLSLHNELYDENDNYIGPKETDPNRKLHNEPVDRSLIVNKKDFEITPTNLKEHFLKRAAPLIDDYIDKALGKKVGKSSNQYEQHEVWDVLKTIILSTKSYAPIVDLKGGTIDEQVSKILALVSTGKLTLEEGKEYLSLVQQGFELTELPEIIAKMEALEKSGGI